jgi:hypothetical protein
LIWCGTQLRIIFIKKALVLLHVYDRASKKQWFYGVFLVLGSGCLKKAIKALVLLLFLHMESVSGIWNLRRPTFVAKTTRFTVFLAAGIEKALVFIAFEQHWSGAAVFFFRPQVGSNPQIQYIY